MRTFLAFALSSVGGYLGWWLGSQFGGVMTSLVISSIGTGVGLYYGRRLTRDMM